MAEVANLYASLGLRTNVAQWRQGDAHIQRIANGLKRQDASMRRAQRGVTGLGLGLRRLAIAGGAIFGLGKAKSAFIDFNSNVEDTKNQIAGMMALATKTNLNDNLAKADKLLARLQDRAAKLPGTTAEYAKMLGMITQPVLDAKLGMQDLEDITVSAVVAAKALGVEGEVAARDIDQAIRGQFKSVDQLTGKLLGSIGFKGESGRAKFNAMDVKKRAQVLKQALTQKQIQQLGAAQGETFSGVMSTLQDTIQRFLGKVGLPLFKAITAQIKQWNAWLDRNSAKIQRIANIAGTVLLRAFEYISELVETAFDTAQKLLADKDVKETLIEIGKALELVAKATIAFAKSGIPLAILKNGFKQLNFAIKVVKAQLDGVVTAFNAVRDAFDSVATFIADKINWIDTHTPGWLKKLATIGGGFVGNMTFGNMLGSGEGEARPSFMNPAGPAGPAMPAPSRSVPQPMGGFMDRLTGASPPPVVNVIVSGELNEVFNMKVDKRVTSHQQTLYRNMNAAIGGEEQ